MGKLVSSAHPFTLADQWLLYEFISATRRRDIENLRWEKGAVLEENLRPNLDEVRAWLPIKYLVTVLKVLTHSIQPQSEQQYFHKYCNLVAEYMGGEGLDITGVRSGDVKTCAMMIRVSTHPGGPTLIQDLSQPPVHYRVDVRANEDIYIMTRSVLPSSVLYSKAGSSPCVSPSAQQPGTGQPEEGLGGLSAPGGDRTLRARGQDGDHSPHLSFFSSALPRLHCWLIVINK